MRTALALAAVVAIFASATAAQTTAPAAPGATAAPAAPEKSSSTVSGVTVQGGPRKQCAPKDNDCIALVMAEVKERYPEQLKKFCYQQEVTAVRQTMQAQIAGWCDGPGQGASAICSHYVSPVVKQVCAPDKPTAKK